MPEPENPSQASSSRGMLKHLWISLGIIAFVLVLVKGLNGLVEHDPQNVIDGARASLDFSALKNEYRKLIHEDPKNLVYHRGYLDAHLAQPKVRHTRYSTIERDDKPILAEYNSYTQVPDPVIRDIGFYGLGYYYAKSNDPDAALSFYGKILNRELPYLNNSIGFVYLHREQPVLARQAFYREIALKGNIDGAVQNLSEMFYQHRQLDELRKLKNDPALASHVPPAYLRFLALYENAFVGYFQILFKAQRSEMAWDSLLASLVIALMFLIYIYFVDIFEKEKISLFVAVFGMGMVSAVLCTILYDAADFYLGFALTGKDYPDILFYIFGVGLIEEFCKAVPVLIVLLVLKKIKEPVELFIYAAVSALGFACLENTGYFSRVAMGLIMGRAMIAVVIHICLTCLAVYGIFYSRFRAKGLGWLYIPAFFGTAMVVHGLYDFFITSSLGFSILSTVLLVFMMLAFRNMVESALDLDENLQAGYLSVNLTLYLFYGLLAIFLMQFAFLGIRYNFGMAVKNMGLEALKFYFLAFVLIVDFGRLKIVKNKWHSLFDSAKD